jgi:hypothetical protein
MSGPDLSDDNGGDDPVHPGDLLQERVFRLVGQQGSSDGSFQRGDVGLEQIEPSDLKAQQEAVVRVHAALELQDEIATLAAQESLGHFG